MIRSVLLLICLFGAAPLFAQLDIEIGEWKAYLPYNRGLSVTQSDNKVYYATDWSILIFDKEERSVQRFSKIDGLSNVGMRLVKYNRQSDILIAVYDNSVIDLVKPEGIFTLFDIRNFQGITGDKEIYDIYVEDGQFVYLATNYGISKMDLFNNQFPFTTFTGVPINQVLIYQDYLYAAANDGLYRINRENPFAEDFNNWDRIQFGGGFPEDYTVTDMAIFNDNLHLAINDSLFVYDGQNGLEFFYHDPLFTPSFLTAEGEHLLAGLQCIDNCKGRVLILDDNLQADSVASFCVDIPYHAVEDQYGDIWLADDFREFRIYEAETQSCERVKLNAPYSHNIYEMTVYNDELWIASGGVTTNFSYLFLPDGFFSLIDNQWRVYNKNNESVISELFDFIDIAVHPETGNIFAASYIEGLAEYDRTDMTLYNEFNSSLGEASGDTGRIRVSGLAFDEENNLWITNFTAERPISVLTNEGQWRNFKPSGCLQDRLVDIVIDRNGYKWMMIEGTGAGLMIFDSGDLDVTSDDRCRVLTTNNSNLPSNNVNCLEVDLDGDIWVGTDQGPIVFECGGNAFEDDCIGSLRIVEQDDFGAYLLETENIRTIAVDGANNKWFGTDNGVFVQSPNGEEQIAFYDVDNSPLFDNIINDIAINPNNGEVFIGTNKGLQSIRGTATEGTSRNSNMVMVFPNPVRPEYDGLIAINGLARDANVKITDMNGQLVYETTANGGQAIWDGRDYTGRKASSGVYLIFSTSSETLNAPDAVVAKILFMN